MKDSSNMVAPAPPLSAATPLPKSSSLPISRSTGTAPYEKPERARTSHACEPCRERKTKCDGERPSCRRCLHTSTNCHYGYGKGWRKRKTAEDLTATSRRLARYECLLNDILPMVPPNVRSMIEEVREQDALVSTTSSETTETDASHSSHPSIKHESTISSTSGRLPLQLPVPNALVTQGPRPPPPPPLAGSFDTVPHPVGSGSPLPNNLQRQTSDEPTVTRLPSITPDGVLIEPGTRERSPSKFQHLIDSAHYLQDRMAFSPSSPTNRSSFGETSIQRSTPG